MSEENPCASKGEVVNAMLLAALPNEDQTQNTKSPKKKANKK